MRSLVLFGAATVTARAEIEKAIPEADLQNTILDALDTFGWLVFHDNDSRRNRSGFPDICAVHPDSGALLFYEIKTVKGRVRPTQAKWLDALWRQQAGRVVRLVRPVVLDEVIAEIRALSVPARPA